MVSNSRACRLKKIFKKGLQRYTLVGIRGQQQYIEHRVAVTQQHMCRVYFFGKRINLIKGNVRRPIIKVITMGLMGNLGLMGWMGVVFVVSLAVDWVSVWVEAWD